MIRRGVTLVAAMTATVTAVVAQADEPAPQLVPYTVVKGDTCDVVARKTLGDAALYTLVHKYNPQLGPSPHHLKEGQVLMVPLPPPDARLELIRNRVEVQSSPGELHQPLFRGNRLSTGDASAADMKFRDDTELSMGERSLVIILGATKTGVKQDNEATLVNGNLRAHLADLAGRPSSAPLNLTTQSGTVRLGPGDVQVGVDDQKATRLAVYRGKSSLTAQNRLVKVNEGFGSKAEQGKFPTPPRPLPPAPEWKPAPAALTLTSKPPIDVTGDYTKGAGVGPDAAEWHVQIARDATFKDVVADVKVPEVTTHLEAKQLEVGTFFVHVSAIDADHFEGPWGAAARMTVARIARVDDGNRFGAVEIPGSDLACALDDAKAAPIPRVRFDRLSAHVLRCALVADPAAVATLDLPAEPLTDLTLKARWLTIDPMTGEGEMALTLTDTSGEGVSRAEATIALATQGSILISAEPAARPGEYFVRTRAFPGVSSVAVTLSLRGHTVRSNDVVIEAPPPVDEVQTGVELGAGGGVGIVGGSVAQVGPRFDVRAAVRVAVGPGDVTLGLRGMLEHYQGGSVTSADVGVATPLGKISHTDYGLGIPLAFRLGTPDVALRPYLSATPQLVFQSSKLTAPSQAEIDGSATWFAVTPALGLELRSGPGSFFLEGGYRFAWNVTRSDASITPRGVMATVGYVFQL